jgi:hypothetical protein
MWYNVECEFKTVGYIRKINKFEEDKKNNFIKFNLNFTEIWTQSDSKLESEQKFNDF